MGQCIMHHKDRFLIWSTVVDAPITEAMTEAEMREHLVKRHGTESLHGMDARFNRARAYGTSWHRRTTLAEEISGNSAGPNESELTLDEFLAEYFPAQSKRNRDDC